MSGGYIEQLIKIISKLPSLGTRSARRIVLYMLKKRESVIPQLITALQNVYDNIKVCEVCGNYDTISPCSICTSTQREKHFLCVEQNRRKITFYFLLNCSTENNIIPKERPRSVISNN